MAMQARVAVHGLTGPCETEQVDYHVRVMASNGVISGQDMRVFLADTSCLRTSRCRYSIAKAPLTDQSQGPLLIHS